MRALLPNTLSLSNLVLGFLAMVTASAYTPAASISNSDVIFWAAIMIIIASICDGFDGPAARWLKVKEGGVGPELDTLADLTTFGIAPAFLMYKAVFFKLGPISLFNITVQTGMLICSVYVVCAAYRLARFNINKVTGHFRGLPSPAAGLFVALVLVVYRNDYGNLNPLYLTPVFLLTAILMVSTLRYSKPNKNIKEKIFHIRLFILVLLITLMAIYLQISIGEVLLALLCIYTFSGIVVFIIHTIRRFRM